MTLVENSFLLQLWLTFWRYLCDAGRESAVGRFFTRLGAAIRRGFSESVICEFIRRDGVIPRRFPESILCRLLTIIINIPLYFLRWVYRIGRGIWNGSIFCHILTGVGRRSFLLIGLLMLVMLVVPHDQWDNTYGLMGIIGVLVFFYLGAAARPRYSLELRRVGPYIVFYMAFICCALICSVVTALSMRFFFFHLTGFLIVLLLVSAVRRYDQLQLVVALAVAGVFIASLYGCYQSFIGVDVVASQQDMSLNEGMPGRIYAFFDNPNNYAELLVMLIPLDLALLWNAKTWRGKLAALVAILPCVAAIGFTYSRSGWIGLALAVLIFIAFKNWKVLPLIVVLGLIAIPLLPETIYNRILTIGNTEDTSTSYRFAIYKASGNLLKDYWLRGVGLGNDVMSEVFRRGYPKMFDNRYPIHTHNNYLQMWLETGILGLVAYLAMIFYQIKSGIKSFCASADRRVKNLVAASVAGLIGILVISIAEYTWFYPRNMFVFFFLFGIIGACVKLTSLEKKGVARA